MQEVLKTRVDKAAEKVESFISRQGTIRTIEARGALWDLRDLARILATVEGENLTVTLPSYTDIHSKSIESCKFATSYNVRVKFDHNGYWYMVNPGVEPEQVEQAWRDRKTREYDSTIELFRS